jgi:hypothetical protein
MRETCRKREFLDAATVGRERETLLLPHADDSP